MFSFFKTNKFGISQLQAPGNSVSEHLIYIYTRTSCTTCKLMIARHLLPIINSVQHAGLIANAPMLVLMLGAKYLNSDA